MFSSAEIWNAVGVRRNKERKKKNSKQCRISFPSAKKKKFTETRLTTRYTNPKIFKIYMSLKIHLSATQKNLRRHNLDAESVLSEPSTIQCYTSSKRIRYELQAMLELHAEFKKKSWTEVRITTRYTFPIFVEEMHVFAELKVTVLAREQHTLLNQKLHRSASSIKE